MIEIAQDQAAVPPNVRGIVAVMFAAGLVGPRIRPEVDMSPLPWLPDHAWLQHAFFGDECFKALDDLMTRRGPKIITRENDFDLAVRGAGELILPAGHA